MWCAFASVATIVGIYSFLNLRRKRPETSRKIWDDRFCFTLLEIAKKSFWGPFFFFLENSCTCVLRPWPCPRAFLSLASRGSVLGKAVPGLGFFLCPWPWPLALSPRLHLWWQWHHPPLHMLSFLYITFSTCQFKQVWCWDVDEMLYFTLDKHKKC